MAEDAPDLIPKDGFIAEDAPDLSLFRGPAGWGFIACFLPYPCPVKG